MGRWFSSSALLTFYLLFYFLRDRHLALASVRNLSPLSQAEMDRLFSQIVDTVHATIYGTVVVAGVQGTLGGLIFWWLGSTDPWPTRCCAMSRMGIPSPTQSSTPCGRPSSRSTGISAWSRRAVPFIRRLERIRRTPKASCSTTSTTGSDIPALRRFLEEVIPQHRAIERYEVEHEFPTIGRRTMLLATVLDERPSTAEVV